MQLNLHRVITGIGPRVAWLTFQGDSSLFAYSSSSANKRLFNSGGGNGHARNGPADQKLIKQGDLGSVRNLSALQNTMSKPIGTKSPRGAEWLMSYFPEVLKVTTDHVLQISNPETANHFSKALQYTMAGGKRVRGLTATKTYEAFVEPEKRTPVNLKLAAILGITMEMSQAWLLGLDDIVDDSKLRRGLPCHYLMEGIGMGAINDCVLISKSQHFVLKTYFGHLRCYPKLMERFNEGELITMCGQTTDFLSSKKSMEEFNMDHYRSIAANKTAYYTYNLPVGLGMAFAEINEPQLEREVHSILQDIGSYFQIQDDFLDCFGDSSVIGKVGNDIQEGKCTWLAVKFMEIASPEQKEEFIGIYGKQDEANVARVKELYNITGVVAEFKTFEDDSYHMLKERINLLPENVPKDLFYGLLENIYERSF